MIDYHLNNLLNYIYYIFILIIMFFYQKLLCYN